MRGFAVPAAVAPAWNRMKELRAFYAVQPLRSAVTQRFSAPLAWRKSRASTTRDSTKRRLSAAARRRSSVGAVVLPAVKSARSAAAIRAALEASAALAEFEVLGVLGRGTFGVVKLARHLATGAAVALKVLDKRAVLELRQEKNILREQTVHLLLDHGFVSKLYATFQDKHALYFVVEYCPGGEVFSLVYDQPGVFTDDDGDDDDGDDDDGDDDDDDEEEKEAYRRSNQHQEDEKQASAAAAGDNQDTHDDDEHTTSTTDSESEDDLAQERLRAARALKLALYLENERAKQALKSAAFGGLQEQHAAFYLACLMVALEYLHEMNILYRDLKLENLVLDVDGYPKLIDFGLSKPDAATHARNRTMCGSMEYMAPEVLQRLPYDQRADMWSFGILMYELLFGATPFYHANSREQGRRITCEPVLFPNNFEDASPDACELIGRLLSKNPSERPTTFAQVRQSAFFRKYFPTAHAWTRLQARQHPAPFVPKLDGPFDTSLFVKAAAYEDEGDDLYGY